MRRFPQSMSAYSPKEYWTGIAADVRSADASGLAPVLHPGAPDWFNRLIDRLQFRAIQRALALAGVQRGARILDVGCGTGRWLRRYKELGLVATGVDATPGMLALARERGTTAPVVAGEAGCLPFGDTEFDCVSDITVVQHIPRSQQPEALGEMVRVLKPGGRLILLELIRGEDAHVFPRSSQDWIGQAETVGAKLIGSFGQEYLLLDRLFSSAARGLTEGNSSHAGTGTAGTAAHSRLARRIYWGMRHLIAPLSTWTDPLAERFCPAHFATHGVFIFGK
jgi:ubiquinone/menaquinone biosynthesis C-methylase UbiE